MGPQLPEDEYIASVRRNVDIVEVVRRYLPGLRPAGKYFTARCPFNKNDVPSFIVHAEKQLFCCFSEDCGEAGDVIRFVARMEGVSDAEAVRMLSRWPDFKPKKAASCTAPPKSKTSEQEHDSRG